MGARRVIILLSAICLLFSACSSADDDAILQFSGQGTPTSRTYAEGEFKIEYADDSLEMIRFSVTESPFQDYDFFNGTVIPDPSSMEGFSLSMPYNYNASLKASSRYFSTCLDAGFKIKEFLQNSQRVEMTLYKDDTSLRIVIFEASLKIYAKGLEKESWR